MSSMNDNSKKVSEEAERVMRDEGERKSARWGVIGVCALDSKSRSKPCRNILNRLIARQEFEVIIFGDKVILDEEVENWPVCDYLISFFSSGFPLDKAMQYVALRKPFCVNELAMQKVLWDRRICLRILDKLGINSPKRLEVNRDGGPKLDDEEAAKILYARTGLKFEGDEGLKGWAQRVELRDDGETLWVDGKSLGKPFVEKPVSGEDHNINIYYTKKLGGGGRRLFRKVNDKSSERDANLSIPRCILDDKSSFIYEEFLVAEGSEDVKAYTVGRNYCHAESRKSPVVDGLVKRNPNGKEVRYVATLTKDEAKMAAKISDGFGQRVCGFDLLRANGRSYVIDVNGWSFVKDNNDYYDRCSAILKQIFIEEKLLREGGVLSIVGNGHDGDDARQGAARCSDNINSNVGMKLNTGLAMKVGSTCGGPGMGGIYSNGIGGNTGGGAGDLFEGGNSGDGNTNTDERGLNEVKGRWKLKGLVSVIRHADRTPKQKIKFTFHTEPFVALLKGHREEVLLMGEEGLKSVLEAVERAFVEGVEDKDKLNLLKMTLERKGKWMGTKVQIKPMFRKPQEKSEVKGEGMKEGNEGEKQGERVEGEKEEGEEKKEEMGNNVTLSRVWAVEQNLVLEKLQLIVKWGGEPTHSARYQSQDLGENLRNELLLLNKDILKDVSIYSSSERRSRTSAQIFAAAFLDDEKLGEDFVKIKSDVLDDSNAAKDMMDGVKKRLKRLLKRGKEGCLSPTGLSEIGSKDGEVEKGNLNQEAATPALSPLQEHLIIDRDAMQAWNWVVEVVEIMKILGVIMRNNYAQRSEIRDIRWCCGDDADLFRERWEKLMEEFVDEEKIDSGRICELYDSVKFDVLHNRTFIEWAFGDYDQSNSSNKDEADTENLAVDKAKGSYENGNFFEKDQCKNLNRFKRLFELTKHLYDFCAPREYGVSSEEKLEIGLLTSLPLLKEIVNDLQQFQASSTPKCSFYFTKESHIYTLLNCILQGGIPLKQPTFSSTQSIPELDYLTQISFELFESSSSSTTAGNSGQFTANHAGSRMQRLSASPIQQASSTLPYQVDKSCATTGGTSTAIKVNMKKSSSSMSLQVKSLTNGSSEPDGLFESRDILPQSGVERELYPPFNYTIRIVFSPGCQTGCNPLDIHLDSKHCIASSPRKSLTSYIDWQQIIQTLSAKFNSVKLPKTFIPINLSSPQPCTVATTSNTPVSLTSTSPA